MFSYYYFATIFSTFFFLSNFIKSSFHIIFYINLTLIVSIVSLKGGLLSHTDWNRHTVAIFQFTISTVFLRYVYWSWYMKWYIYTLYITMLISFLSLFCVVAFSLVDHEIGFIQSVWADCISIDFLYQLGIM